MVILINIVIRLLIIIIVLSFFFNSIDIPTGERKFKFQTLVLLNLNEGETRSPSKALDN